MFSARTKSLVHSAFALLFLLVLAGTAEAQTRKIFIDPGHGGGAPGGSNPDQSLIEKNIVLDVSKHFRDLLNADTADTAGGGTWVVGMTRDTDKDVGLTARAVLANDAGADRFLSIHSNDFTSPSANGTETFSFSNGSTGAALRNLVQEEMIAAWGLTNRGNKTANFAVLRETAMPAVLHELGFVDNPTDAAVLKSPEKRKEAAIAHLKALQRHYSLAPYVPGEAPQPEEGKGDVEIEVVDADGPLEGAAVTLNGEDVGATDLDGLLVLKGVAAGSYVVGATAEGYRPNDREVTVKAEETALVTLTLEASSVGGEGEECDEAIEDCEDEGETPKSGGCQSTGGASALWAAFGLLLGLAALRRRHA